MNTFISSNIFTIVVACIFLIMSLVLMGIAIRNALQNDYQLDQRIAGGSGFGMPGMGRQKAKKNLLTSIGSHLTLPDSAEISRLRFQLSQAGYYDADVVKNFIAIRVICLLGPQFVVMAMWSFLYAKLGISGTIWVAILLAILGFIGPLYFIRWKKMRRIDKCRKGFPDMMDLMVACIEAGLGLDAALIRVSHEIGGRYPPLKVNLEIMNLELRAGRLRHEAMIGFAERIGLDEAKALAVMLKQAEDMGSSIGAALRTFSEDMRAKRMLTAEEKAMSLSAKLTVPLILFIFPTIMVLLLVPAAIRLMESFA